jgi:K+-sensing histidine kinase KdpD
LDEESDQFAFCVYQGFSQDSMGELPMAWLESNMSRVSLLSATPIISEHLADETRFAASRLQEEGFHSAAYVPLKSPQRPLGVLSLASREPGRLNQRQRELLTAIAHQISIAIQNAKLYEDQQIKAERFQNLTRLNQLISASLDMDRVLREIARTAATLMCVPLASFIIADEKTQTLGKSAYSNEVMTAWWLKPQWRFGDTGSGIPFEKQQAILNSFTQADGSATRRYDGIGLGLTLAKRLTELMGGQLWLESIPGRGSTFHFIVRLGIWRTETLSTKPNLAVDHSGLSTLVGE